MEYFALDLYQNFSCLAGKCPSTCCAGWKILVDRKDYQRFAKLPDEKLRQDILANIQIKEDTYYFLNREDGSCAMLDADGLCRIQRNTDEKTLCNTCRKYPRIINTVQEVLYLSMAASCPVIADYIVSENITWEHFVDHGGKNKLCAQDIPIVRDVFERFSPQYKIIQDYSDSKIDVSLLLSGFEKVISQVLEIIVTFREGMYLVSVFDVMEQEKERERQLNCLGEFTENSKEIWKTIRKNYLEYRFLSRRLEAASESASECIIQAEAELLLIRAAAFCHYVKCKRLSEKEWSECIQMVYRFCVHGKKVAAAFHQAIVSLFSKEDVWTYLLL